LGAVAVAGRALAGRRHRDRDLGAVHRLVEGEADLGLEIAAALLARPRLGTAPGEGGGDVARGGGEAATAPTGKGGRGSAPPAPGRSARRRRTPCASRDPRGRRSPAGSP